MAHGISKPSGSKTAQVFLCAGLFAFWILLSQKFDAFHLVSGLLCAAGVSFSCRGLLRCGPRDGARPLIEPLSLRRLLIFIPWLFREIVLSNLQLLYVIIHPKMPIEPAVLRFKPDLSSTLAELILANSITLTPGTLTVDVEDGCFIVHALSTASSGDLSDTDRGALLTNVRGIFKGAP